MDHSLGVYKSSLSASRIRRNVLISGVVFLGAFAVALVPEGFDRPLIRLINILANRSALFDHLVAAASKHFTFSGAVLMALIWYCWFDNKDLESRARIMVGTLGSFGAGVISRFLQYTLPTHPRPYYDPALSIQVPPGLEAPGNTWNSFPSDHVAVFAGLAVVIYIARSRFAIFAIVWTIVVESSRTYMGAHYPSDLIGGAALAAIVVWAAQASRPISWGEKAMRWEQSSPSLFYMSAFFLSYQIATLFADIRSTFGIWRIIVPLFSAHGQLS
jgi:membrane-associated phospholipid phosphatase